jgi:hypothetical protein
MFAIKAELKTKGLVLGNGPLLHWAFMKFRGPKALNDKLPVSSTNQSYNRLVDRAGLKCIQVDNLPHLGHDTKR